MAIENKVIQMYLIKNELKLDDEEYCSLCLSNEISMEDLYKGIIIFSTANILLKFLE